jgi:diacylglycerol kinase (ATP)
MNGDHFSSRSRLRSFRYAFKGLKSLISHEHNSRIHLFAAVTAIIAGIILKISTLEWTVIIVVIGMVFMAELFNSSIEAMSDTVRPEFDEGIRKAKDYAAAAVLVAALISLIAGGIIFIPRIFKFLSD